MNRIETGRPVLGRRAFLMGTAAIGGALMAGARLPAALAASPPLLRVETRTLEVNKKAATVFSISNRNGKNGIIAAEGDRFKSHLLNASKDPLIRHWHGQVLAANDQDRARPRGGELAPAASDDHDFELTPGTHWMHSHSLTEQQLLAAPMVAVEKDAGDAQDVVIMLHDFAFRTPQEILAELVGPGAGGGHGSGAPPAGARTEMPKGTGMGPGMMMGHGGMGPGMMMGPGGMGQGGPMTGMMMGAVHANDVRYDAFLANDRTLDDPEVVRVEKGGRVRLRIINGGTATVFFISTGALKSTCIAVDGSPCQPVEAGQYPLAQGQRIDLVVEIPKGGGTFPVLAQVEDDPRQTGLILATAGAAVAKISGNAKDKAAMAGLGFEQRLRAAKPLDVRKPDKTFRAMLGEQPGYRWSINGRIHGEHEPFNVKLGERVEITFMNPTSMMHPMHLHGHHFQVVAAGGARFSGPMRDTVIVPAHAPVTVAFDAKLKGSWFLHCHHLYHMAGGMMTEVTIS